MDYDNLSAAVVGQMTAYTDRTITDINDLDSDVAETRMSIWVKAASIG